MSSERTGPSGRRYAEDGPIFLWRQGSGVGGQGLILVANVCPFPGCPDRRVLVDGFLMDGPLGEDRALRGDSGGSAEPEWAFAVLVQVDGEGGVRVEESRNRDALAWFLEALDDGLRAALRVRFERGRAVFDAVLGGGADPGPADHAGAAGGIESTTAEAPADGLAAVLAGLERGIRSRESLRERGNRAFRAGRNDPCPCGSGKKYKRCCLRSS
jgi:hypothetical protein